MTTVTVRVLSDEPVPSLVEGVVVEFYDAVSAVFQTNGVTDVDGEVIVSLPDGSYDVLLYKVGLSILPKQPQRISVDSLQVSNTFEVTGHLRTKPESIDPLRCTVSGFIIGVDGKQAKHRLIFEPVKTITVLSDMVIAPYSRREVASNEDGYFEFELLRNTKYTAYFVFPQGLFGTEPGKLDIITPDQPSVGLDVLLFPVPVNLTFSVPTISLVAGGPRDESVEVELTFTDGSVRETLGSPWAGIRLTNTNADVVQASIDATKLCLIPITPGTATITTIRTMNDRAFFDPLQEYTTDTVVVTVT